MSNDIKDLTRCLLVGFTCSKNGKTKTLVIGERDSVGQTLLINIIQGEEAEQLYSTLITVKNQTNIGN